MLAFFPFKIASVAMLQGKVNKMKTQKQEVFI